MNPPVAAILAGGVSRRMGRDKAVIVWRGETLLARTARIAQKAGCQVLVVGREQPDAWGLTGVEFIPDAWEGQGPLGGLATALVAADGAPVLALACDLPLLDTQAIYWLLSEAGQFTPLPDGLIVCNEQQREPLFSVYTASCYPRVCQHLAEGRRSLHSLIDAGNFLFFQAPSAVAVALTNVNTPEDWEKLVP